jgi:hypothetical protein
LEPASLDLGYGSRLDDWTGEQGNLNLTNAGSVERSGDSPAAALNDTAAPAFSGGSGPVTRKFGPRELWAAWKRIARKIGDFQARVLLTIFYFVLLAPFAVIVRRTSDPLAIKAAAQRGWGVRQGPAEYTLEMARKQF